MKIINVIIWMIFSTSFHAQIFGEAFNITTYRAVKFKDKHCQYHFESENRQLDLKKPACKLYFFKSPGKFGDTVKVVANFLNDVSNTRYSFFESRYKLKVTGYAYKVERDSICSFLNNLSANPVNDYHYGFKLIGDVYVNYHYFRDDKKNWYCFLEGKQNHLIEFKRSRKVTAKGLNMEIRDFLR